MRALSYATARRPTGMTRHYTGMPPPEPAQADDRELMPQACVVLAAVSDEGFYLYRLDDRGDPAGDTWYPTLAELKEQAHLEYEVGSGDWLAFPEDESDLVSAVALVRRLLGKM